MRGAANVIGTATTFPPVHAQVVGDMRRAGLSPFQLSRGGPERGGERAALQTLREVRGRGMVAPASGVRWLQHRCSEASRKSPAGWTGSSLKRREREWRLDKASNFLADSSNEYCCSNCDLSRRDL